jgi:hypothetical protein
MKVGTFDMLQKPAWNVKANVDKRTSWTMENKRTSWTMENTNKELYQPKKII